MTTYILIILVFPNFSFVSPSLTCALGFLRGGSFGRIGWFGGYNGWGCVVTSLVPLGTALAIDKRGLIRGAIKELNSFPGIEGFDQPLVTTVIYLGWRFKFKYVIEVVTLN